MKVWRALNLNELLRIAVPGFACVDLAVPGDSRSFAEAVEGRVVDKVPDADANDAVLALIDLRGFDDLFLERGREPPIDHEPRAPLIIGGNHEASIVRPQAGCEHAATPWPPSPPQCLVEMHGLNIHTSMECLLFTRIGDLRDGWQRPVGGILIAVADAAIIAVTHGIDISSSVHLATTFIFGDIRWLQGDLHVEVHVDPTATARSLVTEGLLRHEVIGSLHTHANVDEVSLIWQLNCLPEVCAFWFILQAVELFDANSGHVLRAVHCGTIGQGAQAPRQEVNNCNLEAGEIILQLRSPLDTDETCSRDHDG